MSSPFPVWSRYSSLLGTGWLRDGMKLCWLKLFFLILASLDRRQRERGQRSFLGPTESSSIEICGAMVPWFPNVDAELALLESSPLPRELVDLNDSRLSSEPVELSDDFLLVDGKERRILSNIDKLSDSAFSTVKWVIRSSSWSTFVSTISLTWEHCWIYRFL